MEATVRAFTALSSGRDKLRERHPVLPRPIEAYGQAGPQLNSSRTSIRQRWNRRRPWMRRWPKASRSSPDLRAGGGEGPAGNQFLPTTYGSVLFQTFMPPRNARGR